MHVCLLFCLAGTAASQNNRKLLSLKVGQFINWSVEGGYGKYLHHLLWNNYFVLVFISKSEETLSPESTTSCKLSMHRCWMHISIQNITGEVLLKHHYFSHTIFLAWGGIKHTSYCWLGRSTWQVSSAMFPVLWLRYIFTCVVSWPYPQGEAVGWC